MGKWFNKHGDRKSPNWGCSPSKRPGPSQVDDHYPQGSLQHHHHPTHPFRTMK